MLTFLRKRAMLAILFLTCGMLSSFADPQGGGTASDPYLISSAEELVWFRDYVNNTSSRACAKLTADIDLKDVCHPARDGVEEVSWTPIESYSGTFDGNGKKIENLYYSDNNADTYNTGGFFKELSGTIKDLSFTNAIIIGTDGNYAVLAAVATNATINNVTIESGNLRKTGKSTRISRECGGIIGHASNTTVTGCTNHATIESATEIIGGICGWASNCRIKNCSNFSTIKGTDNIGGIIGNFYSNNITTFELTDCANYGNLEYTTLDLKSATNMDKGDFSRK